MPAAHDDDVVTPPSRLQSTIDAHKGPVHVARFNANGRYLLTGGADRKVCLFNAAAAAAVSSSSAIAPIKSYDAHSGAILALSIATDNATFASGGEDRNVCQWDVQSGQVIRRLSSHAGTVHTIVHCGASASDDGAPLSSASTSSPNDVLAVGGFDCTLRLYDLRARGAWRPMMECKEAKDALLCAAWYRNMIWTGSVDGVVRAYDVRAGQLHEDTLDRPITSVTPSHFGQTLLVTSLGSPSSAEQRAKHTVLDVADGTHLQTFEGGQNVQYRCRSTLWTDRMLLAGDEQGCIAAWDVLTGTKTALGHHSVAVKTSSSAVLWTEACRQQRSMVTAGADGKVKLWSC